MECFNILGPEFSIERVAMLGRTLASNYKWDPSPHDVLSKAEHMVFHLLWNLRTITTQLEKLYIAGDIDGATILSSCHGAIRKLSKLLPESYSDKEDPDGKGFVAYQLFEKYILLSGRSICVSDAGRLCNVMHQAQEGDAVVVFEGTDRLFIIRPVAESQQRCRLIGDAYVDGLMLGEAYEGMDPATLDYDIVLV